MLLPMLMGCGHKHGVRIIPIDDFFKSQDKAYYRLSPNGLFLSYLKLQHKKQNLYVEEIATGKQTQITYLKERDITFYTWVNNSELVYYKEKANDKASSEIYIAHRNGKSNKRLATNERNNLLLLSGKLVDDRYLLVLSNQRDSMVYDACRLDVTNGKMTVVLKNPGSHTDWLPDCDGKIRLVKAGNGLNESLWYREGENSPFKKIITNNFKTYLRPLFFPKNEKDVMYAISNMGRDVNALVKIDCKTGKEREVLFSNDTANAVDAFYSRKYDKVSYLFCETWKKQKVYLDAASKTLYQGIDKLLPGTELRIIDQSDNEDVFIIRTFTDRNPGSYYLYTIANKKMRKLFDVNPSLTETELCEMKPISFIARDGLKLQGYLTLPKNRNPKNLPLVVFPHNGPVQRNSWGYFGDVQFLANRGYAVLQVNYRGSSGLGKRFFVEGFKQYGRKIQTDVDDGVKWLIEKGIANPQKIAIYGCGFGGQIALAAAISNTGLYKCAASNGGILNFFSYMKSIPPYYKASLQMIYEVLGNPDKDVDYLRQASPVFHADKVGIPLFITQPGKDDLLNPNDAVQFVRELKKLNKPVRYLELEEGYTPLVHDENRRKVYVALEQFLNENLNKE